MTDHQRRLITRADFDGLVCSVLLRERGLVQDILFATPRDMQAGQIPVSDDDITANLPFVDGVHLAFDHHSSEVQRVGPRPNLVIDPTAPSAARVVFRHYGGEVGFPGISLEMMDAVDRADAAQYSEDEILAPSGWTMLNLIIDPRTGLGRFDQFTIPGDQLMRDLVVHCRNPSIAEILKIPDVEERVHFYLAHAEQAEHQLLRCSRRVGTTVVADLRGEAVIHPCSRFLIYALFRDANLSIQLSDQPNGMVELAMGHSVLNRTSTADVGALMLAHGGGGHAAAGTCVVPAADADRVLADVLRRIGEPGGQAGAVT